MAKAAFQLGFLSRKTIVMSGEEDKRKWDALMEMAGGLGNQKESEMRERTRNESSRTSRKETTMVQSRGESETGRVNGG